MSEIDWSMAPEGAVGALKSTTSNAHHPKTVFLCDFYVGAGTIRGTRCDGEPVCAVRESWDWVVRPWTGEGMPPVGTECEFTGHSPSEYDKTDPDLHVGDKVKIIAHFEVEGGFKMAAFLFNAQMHNKNRGPAYVEQGGRGCFRPIRTPEQIAAEERESEVGKMMALNPDENPNRMLSKQLCEALYDAGYRKQEAQ